MRGRLYENDCAIITMAMVIMAQSFSYNLPLIDGQGNWGTQDDPKSFAAMRYTESKLTQYSELLLSDIKNGTVDWIAIQSTVPFLISLKRSSEY